MIKLQLAVLTLAGLLSTCALAGATGPDNPVDGPTSPAPKNTPKININPAPMDEGSLPPATGTDPRTQGNDNGRQGGAGAQQATPDNGKTGTASKTTSGGSGSEGSGQ